MLIRNWNINKNRIIVFLLILGFLIPLMGFLSMATCDKPSVNECLMESRYVFSDFFYQYNVIRYIYHHHGSFPSGFLAMDRLGNVDGTPTSDTPKDAQRVIYHAPLYYYVGVFLYFVAKNTNTSELFWIYSFSTILLVFTNLFFFLNLKTLSKMIYKKYNQTFVIYALIIFLFLPVHLYLSIGMQEDVFMYFFYMLAIFCYFKLSKYPDFKHAIFLGLVLGISLLSRIASIMIFGGFVFQMIYLHIKKELKLRNNLFISLLVATGVGIYPFIRNLILFKHPLGDMRYEAAIRVHRDLFHTLFKVFSAYWGGVFGGNESIKLMLGLGIGVLCVILIFGAIIYFKKYNNKNINIFWMVGLSTLVIQFIFMCNVYSLVTEGVCIGDSIQARYLSLLNPLVAIFASISLVKIRDSIENKTLRILPCLFACILALLFIIDFLTAISKL